MSRFTELADLHRQETGGLSSPTQVHKHPAFQEIIAMGEAVVPEILERIENDEHAGWAMLSALYKITGEQPWTVEMLGRYDAVRQAWIGWGKENGSPAD